MSRPLTAGRTLARSAAWNLAGQILPIAVAIVVVPHLIAGLGLDRFGVLTLAWTVVGYFTLFDLGLGWALTRIVSEKLAAGLERDVPDLAWTSLALLLALGLAGGALVWAGAPALVLRVLHVPAALEHETVAAMRILAFSIPIVIVNAALNGLLAAQQRFGLINAVRVPLAAFSYLGPLLVLPHARELVPVISVLVGSRLVGTAVLLILTVRSMPALRHRPRVRAGLMRSLLGYGGWITVTNVVGPVMVYFDRFLVGALLTLSAVAYYATPYDLASRVWMVSSPAIAVLFPAFAASFGADRERTRWLFRHGVRYVFCVLFPCALVLATLAREGLTLWLGAEFAAQSATVLQLLAIGVFVNGLAHLALALVQGVGQPSWAAKLHLIELPLYLAGAWWLIRVRGIEGAAIAWLARAVLDAAALFFKSGRLLELPAGTVRTGLATALVAVVLLVIGCVLPTTTSRLVFVAVVIAAHGWLTWRFVVVPGQRVVAAMLAPTARTG